MNNEVSTDFNAWNPGILSSIPSALEPAITLYRPGNSTVDFERAKELSDFCGLSTEELVAFTLERLIVHELLVRVTSDLSVPDGPNYEDLGINLRSMVATLFTHHIAPEIHSLQAAYDDRITKARHFISLELNERLFRQSVPAQREPPSSFLSRLLRSGRKAKRKQVFSEPKEFVALAHWRGELNKQPSAQEQHCLDALIKVTDTLISHRGAVVNEPELITSIATNFAGNNIGADIVSELVGPLFIQAIEREGYRTLPSRDKPVVMNVKGASASGKSTIRPQQQQLADKLGIAWEDFALISPDYWRKYLLDYSSMGDDYKYAAMLTGQELAIIDKKLDRYMAQKADRSDIPHLLIDRFRFDSFSVENGRSQDSKLLSRFGDHVYLFFMITSPAETVVRAWERGLTTGRFKAVDDLLYHNIEAFTGMPALFFSWVLSRDKRMHFEFLDNDVPKGELPKTIAFGSNNLLTVLDLNALCNIDRFRKVNVDADCAEDVLERAANNNQEFLKRCIARIQIVRCADSGTGKIYAVFENGELQWVDYSTLETQGLSAAITRLFDQPVAQSSTSTGHVIDEKKTTLGEWGAGTVPA